MQKPVMKCLSAEPMRSIVYLGLSIFLKLVIQKFLFLRGFISVSADEFARGIRAATWALQPRFNLVADVKDTWLPFEKYLNGLLLLLWPDVIWAPRVTVFIASCLVFIAFFLLVYYLFDNFWVSALAGTFVVFQPWYTWLSGTPMLEMYYLACFLGGLVFLVKWFRKGCRGCWFWAGCCFMLASGFHIQSWTFINLVNLITVNYLYQYIRQKQFGHLWRLIGFYALGNLFIITSAIAEFLDTGHVFASLTSHTVYSKWFYDGYNVSVVEKLLYYPRLIVQNSSGAIWILLMIALVFLLRDKAYKWKLFPFVVAMAALVLNSFLNVASGPPSAAPARYSLFYVMMISPYLAYGAYNLSMLGKRWLPRIMAYTPAMLSAGLFVYSVWWGIVRIPDFPHGMSTDAIETGYYINQVLSQNESCDMPSYMVELKYWDFLAVQLTAGHYEAIVYDREYDLFNRNTPSIFSESAEGVCASLISRDVRYVALQDSNLKVGAQLIGCLHANKEIGHWTIYELDPGP